MATQSTRSRWFPRRKGKSHHAIEGPSSGTETSKSATPKTETSYRDTTKPTMNKSKTPMTTSAENVISIVGPGMRIVGDCETTGTIRIEGTVEGSVRAAKAVVIGKDGTVQGDIMTQDAVISGNVVGTMVVESRLELQSTCKIEGEVQATRLQLEEGAVLNGTLSMGGKVPGAPSAVISGGVKSASEPDAPARDREPAGQR